MKEEQDIRIEARRWCGPIDTDHGASENQVENVALYFYEKGREKLLKEIDEIKKNHQKDCADFFNKEPEMCDACMILHQLQPKAKAKQCDTCGGTGQWECDERGNMYEQLVDCEDCKGTGKIKLSSKEGDKK